VKNTTALKSETGDERIVMALSTVSNTGWAENGLRGALRRRTGGCWFTRSST